jgi:hypothetical protein
MTLSNAIATLAAELAASLELNEKLAARIEALEKRANYHAGKIEAHGIRLTAIELDAELNLGAWEPDTQWHKDNGYQL